MTYNQEKALIKVFMDSEKTLKDALDLIYAFPAECVREGEKEHFGSIVSSQTKTYYDIETEYFCIVLSVYQYSEGYTLSTYAEIEVYEKDSF